VLVYREGTYDDGEGNRWQLDFEWERLNSLASARRTDDNSDSVNGTPKPS